MAKVREIQRKVIYKKPRESIEGKLQVGDMVITDEFNIVGPNETAQSLAIKLVNNPNTALLVKHGDKIAGIINEQSIIKAIAEGRIPVNVGIKELMTENIVEINDDAALEDVLPDLNSCEWTSAIVVDQKGSFRGYFSPKDCELASKRIKMQK
jgi:predicted transcriptional regulator